MAGPSTRGGKRGKKKIYLTPSEEGGQIYQSDRARKSLRDARGNDELGKLISNAYTEKMLAGEMTPEEAGRRSARTTLDRIHDSYFEGPGYNKSRKFKSGGAVRGYKGGGAVCRGGGAAVSGMKFRGVK